VLDAARVEAAALVSSAKEQAQRIRRDSERELAAATARRDSITAQLSNVRNMLATLGGGAAVGLSAEDEHPALAKDAAPEPSVHEQAEVVEHDENTEVHDEAFDAVDAPEQDVAETGADTTAEGAEPESGDASGRKSKAHARH